MESALRKQIIVIHDTRSTRGTVHVIARIAAGASRTTLQPVARAFLGGAGSPGGTRSPGAPAARRRALGAPARNVTVTFWDSTSALKTRLYNELILPAYKQRRPNYTVKYESITTGNLLQKLLAATATGTAPELFELGDWLLPTYFGRDLLDPLPAEAFGFKS